MRLLNETGRVAECFDRELVDSASEEQLAEAVDIACRCLNPIPKLRPSMLQVLKFLERLQAKYDDTYPYPESEKDSAVGAVDECTNSGLVAVNPDWSSRILDDARS